MDVFWSRQRGPPYVFPVRATESVAIGKTQAIVVGQGDSFEVLTPEAIAPSISVARTGATGNRTSAGIAPGRDGNSWSVVEPLLIVSLDYAALPAGRGGNGTAPKRVRG